MCSAVDANKWAPRLVIILQLATWSVVGIVLLQRGATSLRSKPEDRKTQLEVAAESMQDNSQECEDETPGWDVAKSKHINSRENDRRTESPGDGGLNIPPYRLSQQKRESNSKVEINSETTESCIENRNKNLRKKLRSARERVMRNQLTETSGEDDENREDDKLVEDYTFGGVTVTEGNFDTGGTETSSMDHRNDSLSEETTAKDLNEGVASSSRGEAPRLKPVDRAGAAAAMAMLAVGVVMLLLGPAIVILRAVEARRRERRLPKSRARKDLPPTYEEATLMDEAPRYSSLHLNIINEPSAETALTTPSTSA